MSAADIEKEIGSLRTVLAVAWALDRELATKRTPLTPEESQRMIDNSKQITNINKELDALEAEWHRAQVTEWIAPIQKEGTL